jgi:hypothetical protein
MTPSIVGRSTSGARRTLTMVWATGRRVGRWESGGGRRKAAAGLLRAEAKAPSGRRLLRIPSDESQTPARGLRWLDVEAAALLRSLGRVLQRAPRWLVVPLRVLVLEKVVRLLEPGQERSSTARHPSSQDVLGLVRSPPKRVCNHKPTYSLSSTQQAAVNE